MCIYKQLKQQRQKPNLAGWLYVKIKGFCDVIDDPDFVQEEISTMPNDKSASIHSY